MNQSDLEILAQMGFEGDISGLNPGDREKMADTAIAMIGSPSLAAKIIIGKSPDEYNETEKTMLEVIEIIEEQEKHRDLIGDDNYNGMPWKEWGRFISNIGFDKVFSYKFYTNSKADELAVWADAEEGMLVIARSRGESQELAHAKLHCELRVPNSAIQHPVSNYIIRSLLLEGGIWNHRGICEIDNEPLPDSFLGVCIPYEPTGYQHFVIARDVSSGLFNYFNRLDLMDIGTNTTWKHFGSHNLDLSDPVEKRILKSAYGSESSEILAPDNEKYGALTKLLRYIGLASRTENAGILMQKLSLADNANCYQLLKLPDYVKEMMGMPKDFSSKAVQISGMQSF